MYADVPDPYCYPGTTILINRLGFRDQAKLDAFEAEVTAERATQALPTGRLGYGHYRAIHRHLFQDVYAWAGKIRTVRISKEGSTFCYPEHITARCAGYSRTWQGNGITKTWMRAHSPAKPPISWPS